MGKFNNLLLGLLGSLIFSLGSIGGLYFANNYDSEEFFNKLKNDFPYLSMMVASLFLFLGVPVSGFIYKDKVKDKLKGKKLAAVILVLVFVVGYLFYHGYYNVNKEVEELEENVNKEVEELEEQEKKEVKDFLDDKELNTRSVLFWSLFIVSLALICSYFKADKDNKKKKIKLLILNIFFLV